jgi:hypothetical protein
MPCKLNWVYLFVGLYCASQGISVTFLALGSFEYITLGEAPMLYLSLACVSPRLCKPHYQMHNVIMWDCNYVSNCTSWNDDTFP